MLSYVTNLLSLSPVYPFRSVGPQDRHSIIAPCNPNTLFFFQKCPSSGFIFFCISDNNSEDKYLTALLNMPTSLQSSKLLLNTLSFILKSKFRLPLKGLSQDFCPFQACKLCLSLCFFSLPLLFSHILIITNFINFLISFHSLSSGFTFIVNNRKIISLPLKLCIYHGT